MAENEYENLKNNILKIIAEDTTVSSNYECLEILLSQGYKIELRDVNAVLARLKEENIVRIQGAWGPKPDMIFLLGITDEGYAQFKYKDQSVRKNDAHVFHVSGNSNNISTGNFVSQTSTQHNETYQDLFAALEGVIDSPDVEDDLRQKTINVKSEIEKIPSGNKGQVKKILQDYGVGLAASGTIPAVQALIVAIFSLM